MIRIDIVYFTNTDVTGLLVSAAIGHQNSLVEVKTLLDDDLIAFSLDDIDLNSAKYLSRRILDMAKKMAY
ncbi:hypothetical protein [Marinomonas sp. PE14-40]|uniref:hypothetical protein n=1 Tax=Marinomonas sp. PE14-40 TaxID=3060621 RepID=UPI003F67239F